MENKYKNYKDYVIKMAQWGTEYKIKDIKNLLNATKEDLEKLKEWEKDRFSNYLTSRQFELLKNGDLQELKILLKKQLEKEKIKKEEQKQKAIEKYNNIKELGDITNAEMEIVWSAKSGAYGYQCYCTGRVWYKNGTSKAHQTRFTGGCGYDKTSSALSYFCNELMEILILKNDKKILNDEEKHRKYYACEPLFFQYGVGLSSYETMFKNLGYKTKFRYLQNDNIYITIEKKRR